MRTAIAFAIVLVSLPAICHARDTKEESYARALGSLDGVVTANPAVAIKKARRVKRPIAFYLFDAQADGYGDIGRHVYWFTSRDPTRDILKNFVQCLSPRQHKAVRKLIPNDTDADRPHIMVTTPDGKVLLYERLAANGDVGLRAAKRMKEAVEKYLKEQKADEAALGD